MAEQRQHLHILGICGTFMGGVAALAQASGYRVTGSDQGIYPPMSDQLKQLGIELTEGYSPEQLQPAPDLVVIGNALSRGNPAVEHVLDQRLPYCSGAQWLGEHYLAGREVIAVAGTHGKTTTTAMLIHILQHAGKQPGYLIGGVAHGLPGTACAGKGPFVIEADEYDTAFFDKRAKFVHYHPHIAILNNLEFDHADIYPDLAAIQTQFHHLLRTVPASGSVIVNAADPHLQKVLRRGLWSQQVDFGAADSEWQLQNANAPHSRFSVEHHGEVRGTVTWSLNGQHNAMNALAAIAAAHASGVDAASACSALSSFSGVKRRLELLAETPQVRVFDDFAHHPTAIRSTLAGLRQQVGEAEIVVALELRSNTMRAGYHQHTLAAALSEADAVAVCAPHSVDWGIAGMISQCPQPAAHFADTDSTDMLEWLNQHIAANGKQTVNVVFMSNGGFSGAAHTFASQVTAA